MKIKSRIFKLLMYAGILFIAAAICLAVYNRYIEKLADRDANRISAEIAERVQTNMDGDAADGEDPAVDDAEKEVCITVDGVKYYGYLVVPQFDLELPVAAEWNYEQLSLSPCTYSGSMKDGNWVIAGHNYERHFSPLKSLRIGDTFYFIDASGAKTVYEVMDTEILRSVQTDEMKDSGYELSLFTCTYDGVSRYTVRCREKRAL